MITLGGDFIEEEQDAVEFRDPRLEILDPRFHIFCIGKGKI